MKLLLMIFTLSLSFQAFAEIFVCKDAKNKITYQDEPCSDETVRMLKNVPDAPIEDQILAQERIKRANELSMQRALMAEAERQQQEKSNREYQAIVLERRKLDLLEKQRLELEQSTPLWIIGARPGYGFGINQFGSYRYGQYKYGQYKRNLNRPDVPKQKRDGK
ncbi:MAG: hypothetical protein V4570_05205 [Pseudomonadota bacterium]